MAEHIYFSDDSIRISSLAVQSGLYTYSLSNISSARLVTQPDMAPKSIVMRIAWALFTIGAIVFLTKLVVGHQFGELFYEVLSSGSLLLIVATVILLIPRKSNYVVKI